MTLENFLAGQRKLIPKSKPTGVVRRVLVKRDVPKRVKPKKPSGAKKTKEIYVADFETTTDPLDCRVWSWGIVSITTPNYEAVEIGTDIDSYMVYISGHNSSCYFHNLKFDGHFILDWLLKQGYKHVQTDDIKREGTFKTLISDMGQFYSITVKWFNGNVTEFRDSLKKIPMPVKKIADAFKLESSKGEIDYEKPRPVGHKLTKEEEDYLRRDVIIVAQAMKEIHDAGMTRLTVASDSLYEYKKLTGSDEFKRIFPVLSEYMDSEIRRAYRGGFTYSDPRFRGFRTRSGLVLDVNSLYPSVMMNRVLPYGEPIWVEGECRPSKERPLTIFSVTFTAKLKPNHIPCIQIKGNSMFASTEYLNEILEPTTLMVTNVDWELYQAHYDIDILAYGGGWAFHAVKGLFNSYIEKWGAVKAAEKGGKREIAKLHLNSLYGKFASNPNVTSKIPKLVDDAVKLVRGMDDKRPPVYTAAGVFITSWARDLTIRAAQENYDVFAYADTDSLHLLIDEVPENIEIHPSKMGAWKLEYNFDEAFYIRPKAYVEHSVVPECGSDEHEHNDLCYYVTHIAGLPEKVTSTITFDDLIDGKIFHGKLNPKVVPGGIVLKDIPFKLKL